MNMAQKNSHAHQKSKIKNPAEREREREREQRKERKKSEMEMEILRKQNLIVMAFVNDWIGFYILIGIGNVGS